MFCPHNSREYTKEDLVEIKKTVEDFKIYVRFFSHLKDEKTVEHVKFLKYIIDEGEKIAVSLK